MAPKPTPETVDEPLADDEEIEISVDAGEQTEAEFDEDFPFPKRLRKLHKLQEELNTLNPEREDVVLLMLLCLIARQSALLVGTHGVGKSQAVEHLLSCIVDAKVFKSLLWSTMSSDHLFGPVNMVKLQEEGEIWHNTAGYLPEAEYALLDEIFDGHNVLRSLLSLLHPFSRKFMNGPQQVDSPLVCAFGTSNFLREDEADLDAVRDRFSVIVEVLPVRQEASQVQILDNYGKYPLTRVTKDALKSLSALLPRVTVSDTVKKVLLQSYSLLQQKEVDCSMRKVQCAVLMMKAHAIFNGRFKVTQDDFLIARYCLTTNSKDNVLAQSIIDQQVAVAFTTKKTASAKATGELDREARAIAQMRSKADKAIAANNADDLRALAAKAMAIRVDLINKNDQKFHDLAVQYSQLSNWMLQKIKEISKG